MKQTISVLALLTSLALLECSQAVLGDESAQKPGAATDQSPRPVLQIINASEDTVHVYWLKDNGERVSNGLVQPGQSSFITTTLGHRFVVVSPEDNVEITVQSVVPVQALRVDPPDKDGVPAFYTQRLSAKGFPIVASPNVNAYALKEAAYLVDLMLAKRPDIRTAMIQSGSRLCILAHNEYTTDQPEFTWLGDELPREFRGISGKDYWDARARGMGGSDRDPFCSCAEENLLAFPGDPYAAECILIHELAHNIHLRGLANVDPTFDARLQTAYDAAMAADLWKGKYASVNHHEYFAEGVQSWFDNNREDDHDHNHVNTREELLEYDPRLAELCREVFGDTELRYAKPATRLTGHLEGYDPANAPRFEWPERLTEAQRQIRLVAESRSQPPDWDSLRSQVLALGELRDVPKIDSAEGIADEGGLRAVYFEGLTWRGKPTRIFAWMGLPQTAPPSDSGARIPGVVLVHGGGGTAFKDWVRKWNERGFAAISIAVEGQMDQRDATGRGWQRHEWAGPARDGIYGDSNEPLTDQWMYHAVADTILANSLLRSLPQVDPEKVGLMGISWGGIVTSTVIGIDDRFAFAIPTYGCGDLAKIDNQYGRALGENAMYRKVWEPLMRMDRATMPTLWLSWTGDEHFPLDAQRNSYLAAPGPRMVALLPNMGHGHSPAWNPPDSYAFAESIVQTGKPWCRQLDTAQDGEKTTISFTSTKPIDKATLVSTDDKGFTGRRTWTEIAAEVRQDNDRTIVIVTLPAETTAWFVNLQSGDLIASSDFQETDTR